MTLTIWKFEIKTCGEQKVSMPKNAIILALQVQQGTPCIWAQVDPKSEKEERVFIIYGTGHLQTTTPNKRLNYIGTYQEDCGSRGYFVWHVYEEVKY